jgi:hypothetical protein
MTRDFLDKVSRIALALERAGRDAEGSVESLHQDFIDIVVLVPEHLRETTFTTAHREGAAEGDLDEEAQEKNVRLSPPQAR